MTVDTELSYMQYRSQMQNSVLLKFLLLHHESIRLLHLIVIGMTNERQQSSNEDRDTIPGWLDSEYFEKVLNRGQLTRNIKVQSCSVKYALPKGENYISVIYRVNVKLIDLSLESSTSRSFIVKYTPPNGVANKLLKEYNVQEKEMDVYEMVIPKIKNLLRFAGDRAKLYPSALLVDRLHNAIVFEDLNQGGFKMADRIMGLDMIHTKMVLELMAKQHASSLKLLEAQPTLFDRFNTCIVTRQSNAFHSMFLTSFDALIEEISTWSQEWQYYTEKLRKLAPHFIEQCLAVLDHENEDDLRVFIHGDPWTNNMMFKYDASGNPVDVALLDLQFCCYATPVVDLCYFFFTSTQDEIRFNHFDELMQYYHDHLAYFAEQFGCSKTIPTLHQFQQQLLKKLFYAVYSTIVPLPVAINNEPCDADFESLATGNEQTRRFKRIIAANEKYRVIIKELLPVLDRKGLLDKLN